MKTLKYLLFSLLVFVAITVNVNALTKVELVGDNKINYGSMVTYDVKVMTDTPVEGFQFDLNYDTNLTFVAIQAKDLNLILKISDTKDRIIGYGKTINNDEVVATIIFQTKEFSETTNVSFDISNAVYTLDDLTTVKNSDTIEAKTKVVVPKVEVAKTSNPAKDNQQEEEEINKPEENKEPETDDKSKKESGVTKVIKIIIIILLGAFILYLLNKEEKTEDDMMLDDKKTDQPKKSKKETKKTKK